MLMHSAVNQTAGIVPSTVPGAANPFRLVSLGGSLVEWLTVALLCVGAGYFLVRMPRTLSRFSHRPSVDMRASLPQVDV
jgi:hypothetical protein